MSKFKVGYTVRCINIVGYSNQLLSVHGHGWRLGREFKIIEITNQDYDENNSLKMPIYWDEDM